MAHKAIGYLNITISTELNNELEFLQTVMRISRSSLVLILLAKQVGLYGNQKEKFKRQINKYRPKMIEYASDNRVRFSVRIPEDTLMDLQNMASEFYQGSLSKMVMTLLRKGLQEKLRGLSKKRMRYYLSRPEERESIKVAFNTSPFLYKEIKKRAEFMNVPLNNMISFMIGEYLIGNGKETE